MQNKNLLINKYRPFSENDIKQEVFNIENLIQNINLFFFDKFLITTENKVENVENVENVETVENYKIADCFETIYDFIKLFPHKNNKMYIEKCFHSLLIITSKYKKEFSINNYPGNYDNYINYLYLFKDVFNVFDQIKNLLEDNLKTSKYYFCIVKYIKKSIEFFYEKNSVEDKNIRLSEKIRFLQKNFTEPYKHMKKYYRYIKELKFIELDVKKFLSNLDDEEEIISITSNDALELENNFDNLKMNILVSEKISEIKKYSTILIKKIINYIFYFRNYLVYNYDVNFWKQHSEKFKMIILGVLDIKNLVDDNIEKITLLKHLEKNYDIKTQDINKKCIICSENQSIIAFSCGHKYTCSKCSCEIVDTNCKCPVCRKEIEFTLRIFDN
jgi:hypothetical protein